MSFPSGACLVVSYFLGAIPTGYWLGLAWKGVDVRRSGSGNLGATNVFRVLGRGPGVATLLIDMAKGALAVLLARTVAPDHPNLPLIAGLLAVLGHSTSPFVGFRGGKGVATSTGVFAALLPIPTAIAVIAFAVTFFFSRVVSMSSLTAAVVLAVSAGLLAPNPALKGAAVAIALFVFWTHRSNIQRLRQGTENRFR